MQIARNRRTQTSAENGDKKEKVLGGKGVGFKYSRAIPEKKILRFRNDHSY